LTQRSAPKISIIIPVLNTEEYLEACLKSVLEQTLADIEIICVDNGSSDGSCLILEKYQKEHGNFLLFKHPTGRQGAARNVGLGHARGEYIGFVDSDDYVQPDMFEKMYARAKTCTADVVICNIKFFYQFDHTFEQQLPDHWFPNDERIDMLKHRQFFRNLTICNKIFKKQFLDRNNICFPEGLFHEDQLFVVQSLILGRNVVSVREPLYIYRKQRENSVSSLSNTSVFEIFPVISEIRRFINENNYQEKFGALIDELAVSRYLMLFSQIDNQLKRKYFTLMKKNFQDMEIKKPLQILTKTEFRNFSLIVNSPFFICSLVLKIKNYWGMILQIRPIKISYTFLLKRLFKNE
jgi:glycosyltransferase involved in cell wall biosynthesis